MCFFKKKKKQEAKKAEAPKKEAAKKEEPKKAAPKAEKKETPDYRTYHLVKREDGKWEVKFAGGQKAIKLFDTQRGGNKVKHFLV